MRCAFRVPGLVSQACAKRPTRPIITSAGRSHLRPVASDWIIFRTMTLAARMAALLGSYTRVIWPTVQPKVPAKERCHPVLASLRR